MFASTHQALAIQAAVIANLLIADYFFRRPIGLSQGAKTAMLRLALFFLVVSLIAAVFGFTGISAASADIARVLFYIFVVIFLILLILGLTVFRV